MSQARYPFWANLMTGREALSKHLRRELLLGRVCLLITAGMSFVLGVLPRVSPIINYDVLWIFFFITALGLWIAVMSAVRCPWCGDKMGLPLANRWNVAQVSCCPQCGKSLDDPLSADGEPKKGSSKKPTSWDNELA
jgi:hypothetical protein